MRLSPSCGEDTKSHTLARIRTPARSARSLITILTSLIWNFPRDIRKTTPSSINVGNFCFVLCLPQQAEVAQRVPGRLRSRIFLTCRHYKGGRSSAKRTGRLYPKRNPWYSLSEAESTSGHMVLSGVPQKKNPQ